MGVVILICILWILLGFISVAVGNFIQPSLSGFKGREGGHNKVKYADSC